MQFNKYNIFKAALFSLLVYFPIFLHLDTLPIRIWDESRLALNAYEMHKDGNYLVTHYMGEPDMWNTKPPLMIWMQVFFIKILGVNELAVRLPSAIAAFLTCILLLWFSIKYIKDYWFGLIAVLILATSGTYINAHVSRTGDYDALLVLFTTMFNLSFFLYLQNKSIKFLHLFFVSITLAVMTKCVQGLLFVPALLLYALIEKQLLPLIRNKWLWTDMAASVFVIAGYYLLREHSTPGYLQAVWENDLWGRYVRESDPAKGDFWFFYREIAENQYLVWTLLIPCGILLGLTIKDQQNRKLIFFSSLISAVYFIIISLSDGKLYWYAAPLYPFLSLICTVGVHWFFKFLKDSESLREQFRVNIFPAVFLFFIFLSPYTKIIDKVYKPREYPWDEEYYFISRYLQDAVQGQHDVQGKSICYDGYPAQLLFYINLLNDAGRQVDIVNWKELKPGSTVIISQEEIKKCVEIMYSYEAIEHYYSIHVYKINGIQP